MIDTTDPNSLLEYSTAKPIINTIVSDWRTELVKVEARRNIRFLEIDVDQMRESGELEDDETFVPMRVVDDNIRKEQAAYVNYLTQAQKIIEMEDKLEPLRPTEQLEQEFSKGLRYPKWENDWFQEIDGCQLHGWDAMEVLLDESRPLNVTLEHIGHERLFFGLDVLDIQNAPVIVRKYSMTKVELDRMVEKFGFSKEQAQKIYDMGRLNTRDVNYVVYKTFHKTNGKVWVSWISLDYSDDWLKAPVPLYNGVREKKLVQTMVPGPADPLTGMPTQIPKQMEEWSDVQEELYPVFLLKYDENENHRITDAKGRAFYDCHRQEALTALITGMVNTSVRASNVYASPKNPQGTGIVKFQSDIKIMHGRVCSEPLDFFNLPMPDSRNILPVVSYLDQASNKELGQFTDILREKKERVPAYAYQTAQQDASLLTSVQITLLSSHIREVYSYVWRIVQSQALQGLIPFLVKQVLPDNTYVNDEMTIRRVYDIRAAGDSEVLQKQNEITKMMQLWQIVAPTPIAMDYLTDMLKLMLPSRAAKYAAKLQQVQMQQAQGQAQLPALVQALSQALQGVLKDNPQELQKLGPQESQQLKQLIQMANQITGQQQQQAPQAQQGQPVATPQSNAPQPLPQQ